MSSKIDKDYFEKLCALQCNIKEICGYFNCTEEQLKVWCYQVYKVTYEEIYKKVQRWRFI